jgi:hypothetical protein
LQITGRDRGYPALTHLKGHLRIGASIFGPNLNGLPQAVSGVPSALEVARSRALAKLLSDFSLDAESSWCLVHRPRDPYGRSYRPWAPGGELGALAHDGVPVSSRKSESALASRLLKSALISIRHASGACFFPNFESRPYQARLFPRGTPYLSQGSCSLTESQSTPTPAFRVLFFGADFSR